MSITAGNQPQDLREKAEAAGFTVQELTYVCVHNKNRKSGACLSRVFVHALLKRPG